MASTRGGLKDFYKQRKSSGISKAKASKPSSRKTKSPANSASLGSDAVQPAALVSHGSLDLQGSYLFFYTLLRIFIFLDICLSCWVLVEFYNCWIKESQWLNNFSRGWEGLRNCRVSVTIKLFNSWIKDIYCFGFFNFFNVVMHKEGWTLKSYRLYDVCWTFGCFHTCWTLIGYLFTPKMCVRQ